MPDPRAMQFDHLSFNLPDEDALEPLRDAARWSTAARSPRSSTTSVMRSIYFTDPNGIALEASWWVVDATGRPADYDDDRACSPTRPGARRSELHRTGDLASTPTTQLAGDDGGAASSDPA